MTAPLIRRYPCECCGQHKMEPETGAMYCGRRGATGDCDCPAMLIVNHLEELAEQAIVSYLRIMPTAIRRELAEGTGDAFANAVHEQGAGAEFDADAFVERCGLKVRSAT